MQAQRDTQDQATTYLYNYDRNGFDKTQADLLWTGGLSYRLAY